MIQTSRILLISCILISASGWAQKPVVGITEIQTAAQNISCKGWDNLAGHNCNAYLSEGFRVMLETSIVKSGKMDVMERSQIDAVWQEQVMGQAGLTTSGGQIGGLTGVDYLIYGSITKFGVSQDSMSVSNIRGVGSLLSNRAQGVMDNVSMGRLVTEMSVDMKVTDVATGHVVLADTVQGQATQGEAFKVAGIESSQASADPFADVQRIVAARIAEAIVTSRIPIKVIQVQADGTLILNYGNVFLKPGNILALFEVGEEIMDPDTGEVLGAEKTEVGTVQVTAVEPKFSKARIVGEVFPIAVGSVLQRTAQVPVETNHKRVRSGGMF